MIIENIRLHKQYQYDILECLLDGKRLYFECSQIKTQDSSDLMYDAFVIAVLPLMLEKNENLFVKGNVDSILLRQVNEYILPKLCEINDLKNTLRVESTNTSVIDFLSNKNVATGLSCGVDSLATIKEFRDENKPISFVTFFDAGSHGSYGSKSTDEIFNFRLENAKKAAQKIGSKLLIIRTNAHSFIEGRFESAHSFLNISCAFATLGLINEYRYASAYKFSESTLMPGDTSNYDHHILGELYSSYFKTASTLKNHTRLERIRNISNLKISQEYLDVCTNSLSAKKNGFQNCSSCHKCMRTFMALENFTKLDNFSKIIDIEKYESSKMRYIHYLLSGDLPLHDQEILCMLHENKLITYKHKLFSRYSKFKKALKALLKNVLTHD